MIFKWGIPKGTQGNIAWISNPFLNNKGIFTVSVSVMADGCYYSSRQAWSSLPYLELGGMCIEGKPPVYTDANAMKPHILPIRQITATQDMAMKALYRSHLPFTEMGHGMGIKSWFGKEKCVVFSVDGLNYVIPYFEVLRAFTGGMNPLLSGILHEGIFDTWILNEHITGSKIEVEFSNELSLAFLKKPGVIETIIWLRYTPELYLWWNTISTGDKMHISAQLPEINSGKLVVSGEQYKDCFLVKRMQIRELKIPFAEIEWTHPQMMEKKRTTDKDATAYPKRGLGDNPENETGEFSNRATPSVGELRYLPVVFANKAKVHAKLKTNTMESASTKSFPDDQEEYATTNEYGVAGRTRQVVTLGIIEQGEIFPESLEIRGEFKDFFDALSTVPGLQIEQVSYAQGDYCLCAVARGTFRATKIVLVECCNGVEVTASTLFHTEEESEGKTAIYFDFQESGSWRSERIEKFCKREKVKYSLLRHYHGRTKEQWGELMRQKLWSIL